MPTSVSLTLQVCLFGSSVGGQSFVHAWQVLGRLLGSKALMRRGSSCWLKSVLSSLLLSLPFVTRKYFGQMIPPRGCAYIVMVHRQDAYRALQKLSRGNYKVNQKSIKVHFYHL